MEEDTEVPFILGRPFLATAQAVVDMNDGTLTLKYGDNEVKFGVGKRIEDDDPVNYMKVIDSSLDDALRRCNMDAKHPAQKTYNLALGLAKDPYKRGAPRRQSAELSLV
ncbi:putative aspartic peptidase domain superfamily [Helianthus annuus]|nr:putative aspartic peptidase domain superfamily [Helianthus annuus]